MSLSTNVAAWHDEQVEVVHGERKVGKQRDQPSGRNVTRYESARPHGNPGTVDRGLERVIQRFEAQLCTTAQVRLPSSLEPVRPEMGDGFRMKERMCTKIVDVPNGKTVEKRRVRNRNARFSQKGRTGGTDRSPPDRDIERIADRR